MPLEGRLDHAQAKKLMETLAQSRGSALVVSASGVEHLGAQCAQVLVAARATWRSEGHAFEIIDATPEFADAVRLLGLESQLQS
jgi:chemotaxis protein CheX